MYESNRGQAALRHKTRLFFVGVGFLGFLAGCDFFLSSWVALLVFLAGGVLVVVPLALGIGPLGRRFAREVREPAVAKRAERQ